MNDKFEERIDLNNYYILDISKGSSEPEYCNVIRKVPGMWKNFKDTILFEMRKEKWTIEEAKAYLNGYIKGFRDGEEQGENNIRYELKSLLRIE